MSNQFYIRFSRPILIVFALLLPFVGYGALRAVLSNSNDVRSWLPDDDGETIQYKWFKDHFGLEEFVLVTWSNCTLDDPRLAQFAAQLISLDDVPAASRRRELFAKVVTGPGVLESLTRPPARLGIPSAIDRLLGILIGPDRKQTCAVVTPTDLGKEQLHEMLDAIKDVAVQCGVERDDLRLGGPPVMNAAIDIEGAGTLTNLAGLSGLVALAVSWWCFRSLKLTLLVLATGAYGALISLAIVWLAGSQMNAILLMMPPLVYVAAMSGAIHLTNYYLEALTEFGPDAAPMNAVGHARLPLILAAATTAIGLLSLCYSELLPIQQFGIFSACGVIAATALVLLFLPAAFQLWPSQQTTQHAVAGHEDGLLTLSPRWHAFAEFVVRNHALVAAGCIMAAIGCGYGLRWLRTSIEVEKFFTGRSDVIQDYEFIQRKLGALVPMEVVLRIQDDAGLDLTEQMLLVEAMQDSIAELPEVGSIQSAILFAPPLVAEQQSGRRAVLNRRLERAEVALTDAGYLRRMANERLWRISIRLPTGMTDSSVFVQTIRETVEPVLDDYRQQGSDGVTAVYTGMVPIFTKAQHSLLDGLRLGFGTDLLLIVIAVVVLLRHWTVGLLICLTSMFPGAIVFGLLSWFEVEIDVGSIMTPSIALGVTVDDVVHFLLWYRRGIARGYDQPRAVLLAYEGCAKPIYQSWGVIGLGLSVFALSSFVPAFRFGALMIALLTVGLAGNLLFMPSLLAGPLGRIFANSIRRKGQR